MSSERQRRSVEVGREEEKTSISEHGGRRCKRVFCAFHTVLIHCVSRLLGMDVIAALCCALKTAMCSLLDGYHWLLHYLAVEEKRRVVSGYKVRHGVIAHPEDERNRHGVKTCETQGVIWTVKEQAHKRGIQRGKERCQYKTAKEREREGHSHNYKQTNETSERAVSIMKIARTKRRCKRRRGNYSRDR